MMKTLYCVYRDNDKQQFYVFLDGCRFVLFHWKCLSESTGQIRDIKPGQAIQINNDSVRGLCSRSLPGSKSSYEGISLIESEKDEGWIVEGKYIDESHLKSVLGRTGNDQRLPLVFRNCKFGNIDIEGLHINFELAFFECEFVGNARFLSCIFSGALWFCNSKFNDHFSLKSSNIKDSCHLESCDFRGNGGVSLRLLESKNVYMDFGVRGPNDMTWINEVKIPGELRIGGIFPSDIQIHGKHEKEFLQGECFSNIGYIGIGLSAYSNEVSSKTSVAGAITLEDVAFGDLVAEHSNFEKFSFGSASFFSITLKDCFFESDFSISQCEGAEGCGVVSVIACNILRNLVLRNVSGMKNIDLRESSTHRITYLEDCQVADDFQINLHRFASSRFLVRPTSILYGNAKPSFFKPQKFLALEDVDDKEKRGQQYCSLKHWMADAGQLDSEDIAYFHMRDAFCGGLMRKILYGRIFGWGLRLSNILFSISLVFFVFGLFYLSIGYGDHVLQPFVLSAQAMVTAFFGDWPEALPNSEVSLVVTVQSIIGVLFVTVLVGAYIRKMLR